MTLPLFAAFLILRASPAVSPVWFDQVDSHIRSEIAQAGIPGLAVAVVTDQGPIFLRGYGTSDAGPSSAITPDTRFEIASLTKTMTALALLQLRDEGLLGLDDPVRRHLPWFKVSDEADSIRITLRQLIEHRSGIAMHWVHEENLGPTMESAVRALSTISLVSAPGSEYHYATVTYSVLALVIEAAGGQTWEEAMRTRIFNPLGMTSTSPSAELEPRLPITEGHRWFFGFRRKSPPSISSSLAGGGGVISTVRDMAAFVGALIPGRPSPLLGPHSLEEFLGIHALRSQTSEAAFGWGLKDNPPRAIANGGSDGMGSSIRLSLDRPLAVVLLANLRTQNSVTLSTGLHGILLGSPKIWSVSEIGCLFRDGGKERLAWTVMSLLLILALGVFALLARGGRLASRKSAGWFLAVSFLAHAWTWWRLPKTDGWPLVSGRLVWAEDVAAAFLGPLLASGLWLAFAVWLGFLYRRKGKPQGRLRT